MKVLRELRLEKTTVVTEKDGDQVTVKAAFTLESNEELEAFMNSKAHYISLGANNIRTSSNEALQALYNLTLVLPGTRLTDPEF